MQNNQQNRGRQDQGYERDNSNDENIQQQQNNESLNTASQQPVQNLRDKNIGSGRSYDYGADYNSPEQDPERDPSRG